MRLQSVMVIRQNVSCDIGLMRLSSRIPKKAGRLLAAAVTAQTGHVGALCSHDVLLRCHCSTQYLSLRQAHGVYISVFGAKGLLGRRQLQAGECSMHVK